jgi:hypothetical protein
MFLGQQQESDQQQLICLQSTVDVLTCMSLLCLCTLSRGVANVRHAAAVKELERRSAHGAMGQVSTCLLYVQSSTLHRQHFATASHACMLRE